MHNFNFSLGSCGFEEQRRPLVVYIVSGYKHYLIRDLLSPSSIIYTLKTSSDFSVAFGGTGCSSSAGGRTGRSIL